MTAVGLVVAFLLARAQGEQVDRLQSTLVLADGRAAVTETIDYDSQTRRWATSGGVTPPEVARFGE